MDARSERVVAENVSDISVIVPTGTREIISTAITGAIVGIIMIAAYFLLDKYVFASVMCRAGNDASCSSAPTYAMAVAFVIGAVIGLIGLVQSRSYRPLLTVLATAVSFWGLQELVGGMAWYWAMLVTTVLFALTYLLFAWIGRLRSFVLSFILCILLVVLIRIALVS